jgi:hypothetical protein
VPALAIVAIIWILAQSTLSESQVGIDTRAGLRIAGIVLVVASLLYPLRRRAK